MISYQIYKILHILGILLVVASLAGLGLHAANGGERKENGFRIGPMVAHGVGLLIVLVAGFGLLARIGAGFTTWVYLKIALWVVFGALVAVVPRVKGVGAKVLWFVIPLLGAAGAAIALYKPGA